MHPSLIMRVILLLFLILLMRSHSICGKDEGKGGGKGGGDGGKGGGDGGKGGGDGGKGGGGGGKGGGDGGKGGGGGGTNDTTPDPDGKGGGGKKDLSIPDKCGKDKGMVPHPCTYSYSGCKLKGTKLGSFKSKANDMIQMGECWANTRILGQRVAFFVPVSPSAKNYGSEGGPYGTCIAYDGCPKAEDLVASDNLADFCFIWETNPNGGGNKKKGNGTDTCNPKAPGSPALPMPIVCPSTLKCCYSADWYEPGGKLEKYGDLVPTYKGVWFPPKGRLDHKPLFCPGLNLGCPTPNYRNLQIHHLEERKCDVSKCKGGGER